MLGLVACGLLVSAALPLREYLSQRGRIAEAQATVEHQQQQVHALEHRLQQWQDPAYVKAQARTRLHFVRPGEVAYVVLSPTPVAASPGAAALPGTTAVGPEAPWYSQVWGSVRAADRVPASPRPAATPAPAR